MDRSKACSRYLRQTVLGPHYVILAKRLGRTVNPRQGGFFFRNTSVRWSGRGRILEHALPLPLNGVSLIGPHRYNGAKGWRERHHTFKTPINIAESRRCACLQTMEIFMNATLADYFEELEPANAKPPAPQPKSKTLVQKPRSERTDILLWLSKNAPRTVEELKAVRYTLYHRCSCADFKVSDKQDDETFVLSGRDGSVQIVSNKARRYLLWKLRILAREQGWVGRKRIQLIAVG